MKDILLIIVIIIIFIFFAKKFTEKFTLFHNTYNNNFAPYYITHPFNYEKKLIIDSQPSNNINFINPNNIKHEYNDSIYKKKLYKLFEINDNLKILFKISENIKWSNWKNPDKRISKIYEKFINYLNIILKENDINNIYNTFNKYKFNITNNNNLLFNIDLLLYRNSKIYGKHINLIVYYNNDKFYIIYLNIIGNVNQYDIINKNYIKDINNDNIVSYNTNKNKKLDCNSYCDTQIDISDEYVDNKISDILMKNINTPYYNKNDNNAILKNNKYNKDQLYVKNFFMNKINENTNIIPSNF
tara:strand:- start:3708 stop:4607 length:900 start_codon:yes stop_codon:yes gene_type:complete